MVLAQELLVRVARSTQVGTNFYKCPIMYYIDNCFSANQNGKLLYCPIVYSGGTTYCGSFFLHSQACLFSVM